MAALPKEIEVRLNREDAQLLRDFTETLKAERQRGPDILSPREFADRMRAAAMSLDIEYSHISMDGIMCSLLRDLGYGEGVEIFENAIKWYA